MQVLYKLCRLRLWSMTRNWRDSPLGWTTAITLYCRSLHCQGEGWSFEQAHHAVRFVPKEPPKKRNIHFKHKLGKKNTTNSSQVRWYLLSKWCNWLLSIIPSYTKSYRPGIAYGPWLQTTALQHNGNSRRTLHWQLEISDVKPMVTQSYKDQIQPAFLPTPSTCILAWKCLKLLSMFTKVSSKLLSRLGDWAMSMDLQNRLSPYPETSKLPSLPELRSQQAEVQVPGPSIQTSP